MKTNCLAGGLLATAVGLLAACTTGSMEVRLEPPTLQVESLRMDAGVAHLALLVHNRNDHAMLLESAMLDMRIDGAELFSATRELALDISPRGRERITLDAPALPEGAQILDGSQRSRTGKGLQFELSSQFLIDGQRDAQDTWQGFLYPVPGQPGHFR